MTIIALTVPDDLSAALHVPVEQLASELAFAASVRLYEEGRVSLSKAAEIAATDRFTFASRFPISGLQPQRLSLLTWRQLGQRRSHDHFRPGHQRDPPASYLYRLGRLDLLRSLFGRVIVPPLWLPSSMRDGA